MDVPTGHLGLGGVQASSVVGDGPQQPVKSSNYNIRALEELHESSVNKHLWFCNC